jgi:signal transduction histidine kinase
MKQRDIQRLLSTIDRVELDDSEKLTLLADPLPFLRLLNRASSKRIEVDDFHVLQPWAIAAIATLGKTTTEGKLYVHNSRASLPSQFAAALGLDDIISGDEVQGQPEIGRTVKLCEVCTYEEIEPISEQISKLIVADAPDVDQSEYHDPDEVQKTIRYVLIEALRNVIQHSQDSAGAVVLAQRMDKGLNYDHPYIQVAVADCGVGILETLRRTHSDLDSVEVALERSLWPYYSGKFHSYQHGSAQNAGLGLFFISEMAKLTSGKLLVSSRGASLLLLGDPEALGNNKISALPVGFQGTLIAFEMPKRGVADYDALIKRIADTALSRTAKRENVRWIRFDLPPSGAFEFVITVASENTVMAEEFSKSQLLPRIRSRQALVLDFVHMKICTQSYLHALLFEAVRTAFELKVPLYAKRASPSVVDGIHLVEMYTLAPPDDSIIAKEK